MRRVRCLERERVLKVELRRQVALKRLEGMREVHQRRVMLETTNYCEGFEGPCERTDGLAMVSPGTRYCWDGLRGLDPNRPIRLCAGCAHGMQRYWAEMWSDYYSSSGVMTRTPKDIYAGYDDPRITEHNLHVLAGWNENSKIGVIETNHLDDSIALRA